MNGQSAFGNEDFLIRCEPFLTTTTTTTTALPTTLVVSTAQYINLTSDYAQDVDEGYGKIPEQEDTTQTTSTDADRHEEVTLVDVDLEDKELDGMTSISPTDDDLNIIPGDTHSENTTQEADVKQHHVPEEIGKMKNIPTVLLVHGCQLHKVSPILFWYKCL